MIEIEAADVDRGTDVGIEFNHALLGEERG
jgi:hypothetical protein